MSRMSSSRGNDLDPKKPYASPYLAPLPGALKKPVRSTTVRSATTLSGVPSHSLAPKKPQSAKSAKKAPSTKLNFGPIKSQKLIGDQAIPFMDKIQFAMDQMRLLDTRKSIGRGDKNDALKVHDLPKNGALNQNEMLDATSLTSQPSTESSKDMKAKKPPRPETLKKQRTSQVTGGKSVASDSSRHVSTGVGDVTSGCMSTPEMLPVSQPVLKSILKNPPHNRTSYNCTGMYQAKPKNRSILSDGMFQDYESMKSKSEGYDARRFSKHSKKVHFFEQVVIHPVPYESRGSTEWQHNLLVARENMFQSLLQDPRLNMFSDVFGLHCSNPYSTPPDSILGMAGTNRIRRQKF